jgi:hypothetical protein
VISIVPIEFGVEDPTKIIAAKMGWVLDNIGSKWKNIIVAPDKTMLKADYLIDPHPSPGIQHTSKAIYSHTPLGGVGSNSKPDWQHVVYDQSYNSTSQAPKRLLKWQNWKETLGLDSTTLPTTLQVNNGSMLQDQETTLPCYVHGSEDSRDIDTLYLFPMMPPHKECLRFCNGTKDDRNIIVTNEMGVVSHCFRGPPDELNNELLDTYPLHKQNFPNPIKMRVHRIVPYKVITIVGYILIRVLHNMSKDPGMHLMLAPCLYFFYSL